MRKIKSCIIITIIFSFNALYAGYTPWNADVNTGDSLHHMHNVKKSSTSVQNGAQGGAYFLIRFFQVVISPQDGDNCRHIPTCSAYGKQAVMKHGAFIGAIMAGERLLRCNPFYPPERDPVPGRAFGK